ncbi:hypothetical protein [Rhizobium sp. SGZ-381]|uniref:hypothetical protein n=1 Tax=Rhizobium sp. SGZ-381 TaxID=3342800 RepID=UPI00366DAA89
MSVLHNNNAPQAKQEKPSAEAIEHVANHGVSPWMAGQLEGGLTKTAEMHHFLYLSVPHFANAEQAEAKPGEKCIVLARGPGGRGNGRSKNGKRNSPLGVILNFFGIHRAPPANTAEFRLHVEVADDGSLRQSVSLPPGWRVVRMPAENVTCHPQP